MGVGKGPGPGPEGKNSAANATNTATAPNTVTGQSGQGGANQSGPRGAGGGHPSVQAGVMQANHPNAPGHPLAAPNAPGHPLAAPNAPNQPAAATKVDDLLGDWFGSAPPTANGTLSAGGGTGFDPLSPPGGTRRAGPAGDLFAPVLAANTRMSPSRTLGFAISCLMPGEY